MNHLLNIEELTIEQIHHICQRAYEFEKKTRKSVHSNAHVVNMFFENSTRTKLSFEMAENKLAINKYDFCANTSSLNKGEDLYDTINNLSAIGMDAVVLRHSDNNLIKELASKKYFQDVSFINAGSGTDAHPTQALLDYYTMKKHFLDLANRKICIVGDIAHSRVANSNIALLKKVGAKIRCLAPEQMLGNRRIKGVEYFSDIKKAFEDVDVVMALRIQKERIQEHIDIESYIKKFQITKDNLPYAAFLMHPGPVNRDIEIKSDVLETQNAKTILNQARNGVFIRMAILDLLLSQKGL
ncbi:MAG: aspartate carbamoyltransferase catalytic subunit [Candidatus Gastranaerophilales bacterium]|nr:aspartate carbamoyltransferase catalytic subunit [Candidatus Gastranaerophilales bacterium]